MLITEVVTRTGKSLKRIQTSIDIGDPLQILEFGERTLATTEGDLPGRPLDRHQECRLEHLQEDLTVQQGDLIDRLVTPENNRKW